MCGIAGIISFKDSLPVPQLRSDLLRMTERMQPRGPDDEGLWLDPSGKIGFGFRRLAVLDLSAAAHQPMVSDSNRSVLILNGEIYNYQEIRAELEARGQVFRSRSDTEVLLYALETWGAEAIERLNGMFAFAWYDKPTRSLLLARDHAGIKPLYYFIQPGGKGLVFASQFNQLLLTQWGEPGLVRLDVLNLYLRLHHIPPPYGLLQNTFQLQPGHYLRVHEDGRVEDHCWWSLPRSPQFELQGESAVDAAGQALETAIKRQRVADVPLGVFLSGGVDSPLVTAIARKQTGSDLKAFTIGNPGWWQDESEDASRYAKQLEVDFHLLNVTGNDMLDLIPKVWEAQYEPFADYSILPTMMVSRFSRREIKVALSGDGGDELFFGYERPLSLLRNGADFRYPWLLRYVLYAAGRLGVIPCRSEVIAAHSPAEYYFGVNSRMSEKTLNLLAPGLTGVPEEFSLYSFGKYQGIGDLANYSRFVEFYGQLQRGLKKMDMASMHYGLEVRVPLLDREVIETSLGIDPFTNMQNGKRKQVLEKLLERYVPSELIPSSKRGFAVPLGDWLRGPLRPMVEDMLFSGNLYPSGLFDQNQLRSYWQEHLRKEKDHKWGLWGILALQGWARTNL